MWDENLNSLGERTIFWVDD